MPYRKVATCVFIKQCIVEQNARFVDRRIVRNQRTFAEHACAFVHRNHFLQKFFALLRFHFHNFTIFKTHREVVNQFTHIGKGFGRIHDTFRRACFWGSEHFFRRNVGVEHVALQGLFVTACKNTVFQQFHLQIRAVRALIFQILQPQAVEICATLVQVLVMRLPSRHGVVAVRARSVQNHLPHRFHSLVFGKVGEHFFRPSLTGHSRNTPLMFVFQRHTEGLDLGIHRLSCFAQLFLVSTLHTVGIFRFNPKSARIVLRLKFPLCFRPRR